MTNRARIDMRSAAAFLYQAAADRYPVGSKQRRPLDDTAMALRRRLVSDTEAALLIVVLILERRSAR